MKTALALNITVLFMLTVKLGESITCIKCGSERGSNASCEREVVTVDCSSDSDFGEDFDSCFSLTAYGRTQIKDCALHWACEELEQELCKHFKTAGNSTDAKNCRVDCCRGDLCNDGKVRFAAMINASGGYVTIIFWIFATVVFFSIEFGIILPR